MYFLDRLIIGDNTEFQGGGVRPSPFLDEPPRVATGQGHEFMTRFMAFLVKNSWCFLQNHGILLKIHVWNFVLDILQPSNNTRPLTKTKRIPEIAYILLRVSRKFQDWRHIHNTKCVISNMIISIILYKPVNLFWEGTIERNSWFIS